MSPPESIDTSPGPADDAMIMSESKLGASESNRQPQGPSPTEQALADGVVHKLKPYFNELRKAIQGTTSPPITTTPGDHEESQSQGQPALRPGDDEPAQASQQLQELRKQMLVLTTQIESFRESLTPLPPDGLAAVHHQLSVERQTNSQLRATNSSLRDALIKTKPQIFESDILYQFRVLRSSIKNMVKGLFENEFSQTDDPFFLDFIRSRRPMKYLSDRVRGQVFAIICRRILARRYYPSVLGVGVEELEVIERDFEEEMPKMRLNDFIEWRTASIKCNEAIAQEREASQLNAGARPRERQQATPDFVARTAAFIEGFLRPLRLKKTRSRQRVTEMSTRICQEAFRLVEQMRRADELYGVLWEKMDGFPSTEDLLEEETYEVPHAPGQQIGRIAYWTFGALVKRPTENPERLDVLEKASIVCFKEEV